MIGVYGGSFDPIHLGHLETAVSIKNELNLENCLLMPCATPVHKNSLQFSNNERLEMLNLAIEDFPELSLDTRETNKGGDSFTIDTLKDLRKEKPNETFCLIIGMDSFNQFKHWKNWKNFSAFVHLVVLARPKYKTSSLSLASFTHTEDKQQLAKQQNGLLYFASCPLINISSSEIRCKIAANENLKDFLPNSIINYLKEK